MKTFKTFAYMAASVLVLGFATTAQAQHFHRHGHSHGPSSHGGHHHGGHHHGWSNPGHFDYVPGHYQRHRDHLHYVPPHVDYHVGGRRYEVVPDPYGGGYVSPYPHRHQH